MHRVEIRLQGILSLEWSDWLEGLQITHTREGDTMIRGQVCDQAAFYGVIAKVRDLGIKLISASFDEIPFEGGFASLEAPED